jgi:hypothetical protein
LPYGNYYIVVVETPKLGKSLTFSALYRATTAVSWLAKFSSDVTSLPYLRVWQNNSNYIARKYLSWFSAVGAGDVNARSKEILD